MKTLLIVFSAIGLSLPAIAREWTDKTGRTLQAELVGKELAPGQEKVTLQLKNGQTVTVPLSSLSAADQDFVKEAKMDGPGVAAAAAPEAAPAGETAIGGGKPSVFADALKGKLVALTGKRVGRYEMTEEPKNYAFYFSAHWCPPCRAFTPKLVEFYNSQDGKKKDFEIIFVSSDNDENSFEEYIKGDKMPWPAISFRNAKRIDEIRKYAGSGIPCLVLVDREGKVLSDSYEGKKYLGPNKVMNDIPRLTK